MSHSLFVIHVAFSSLILVAGVCVNTISVGVIVRLKLARETSVLFTLHLMIVNLAASIIAMSVSLINSFHSSGKKDMFCRMTGFVVFVLIGVQMCNITLISISAYLKVSHSTLGIAFFQEIGTLLFVWVSFGSYHYVSCQCLQQNSGESSPSQTTRLGVTHSLVDSESLSSVLH